MTQQNETRTAKRIPNGTWNLTRERENETKHTLSWLSAWLLYPSSYLRIPEPATEHYYAHLQESCNGTSKKKVVSSLSPEEEGKRERPKS